MVREAVAVLEADHGGEEEHEGDHGDDHRDGDEDVVGTGDGRAGLAEKDEEDAEESLGEDGDPGSFEARVEFAEGGGKIAVETGDEGEAGGGGEIGSGSADVADDDEEGGECGDAIELKAGGSVGDGLGEAVEIGGFAAGNGEQDAKRAEHVAEGDGDAGEEQGAGDVAAGVLDFLGHQGSRFTTDKRKNHD